MAGFDIERFVTLSNRVDTSDLDWDEVINQKITTAGTVYRFFAAVKPFTYMVMSGVFDRHPGLRIVAAEVNCGWLPFWAQTMDQNLDVRSGLAGTPSQAGGGKTIDDS